MVTKLADVECNEESESPVVADGSSRRFSPIAETQAGSHRATSAEEEWKNKGSETREQCKLN